MSVETHKRDLHQKLNLYLIGTSRWSWSSRCQIFGLLVICHFKNPLPKVMGRPLTISLSSTGQVLQKKCLWTVAININIDSLIYYLFKMFLKRLYNFIFLFCQLTLHCSTWNDDFTRRLWLNWHPLFQARPDTELIKPLKINAEFQVSLIPRAFPLQLAQTGIFFIPQITGAPFLLEWKKFWECQTDTSNGNNSKVYIDLRFY